MAIAPAEQFLMSVAIGGVAEFLEKLSNQPS